MFLAVVVDGVDGIEPQTVELEFSDPIDGVLDHELANRSRPLAIVIYAIAPWRLVMLGEERRIGRHVVAVRPEVIVNHIEEHADSPLMGGVHEGHEIFRPPVTTVRSIGQHSIVAPPVATREIVERA